MLPCPGVWRHIRAGDEGLLQQSWARVPAPLLMPLVQISRRGRRVVDSGALVPGMSGSGSGWSMWC